MGRGGASNGGDSSSSLLLSSLKLSDTKVYEPQIRALLGTASHYCEVVVLKLRTVPLISAVCAGSGFDEARRGLLPVHPAGLNPKP